MFCLGATVCSSRTLDKESKFLSSKIFTQTHLIATTPGATLKTITSVCLMSARSADETLGEGSPLLVHGEATSRYSKTQIFWLSLALIFTSGLAGVVNTSFSNNIEALSENVGSTSVDMGGVFIVRGVGSIIGSFFFPHMSKTFGSMLTIYASVFLEILTTIIAPFCTSNYFLYVLFLSIGFCGAAMDTGGMVLLRKIHGKAAAPWMSANVLAFTLSGILSVILQVITSDDVIIFTVLGGLGIAIFIFLLAQPNVEVHYDEIKSKQQQQVASTSSIAPPHYWVETVCGVGLLTAIGSLNVVTAYLETYVNSTDVITSSGTALLLTAWMGLGATRILLIVEQAVWPPDVSVLLLQYGVLVLLTVIVCAVMLSVSDSAAVLWSGMILWGVFSGPTVGLIFDLNNKLTYSSAQSTAILMVGLNLGVAAAPYLTSVLWTDTSLGSAAFMVTLLSLSILSLTVLVAPLLSYKDAAKEPI